MTSLKLSLFLTILSNLICSLRGFCEVPQGDSSSYGDEFMVVFPATNVAVVDMEYMVYLTNPNNSSVSVDVHDSTINNTWSVSVPANGFKQLIFNQSQHMISGEGTFANKYVHVTTSGGNIGVHVFPTEGMDGYTPLPVTAWGNKYVAVTYCVEIDGPCQIVIMSNVATQVQVILPAQDASTISYMNTLNPAMQETLTIDLKAYEVHQLQRSFDITGAVITSNEPIAVMSGSAMSWVGHGHVDQAMMEYLPSKRTFGTDFVLYLTPTRPSIGDFVRITATQQKTFVLTSAGYSRISMQKNQHITRRFDHPVVHIQSDKPIIVVKFSQSEQNTSEPGYPTMTWIYPTSMFLANTHYIIPKITSLSTVVQQIIVIGTTDSMACLQVGGNPELHVEYLSGTNLVVKVFEVNSDINLYCNVANGYSYGVYSYMTSDSVTFQVPVAYSHGRINFPCSTSDNSPGDEIDNDCDGLIDEDFCTEGNIVATEDCGPIHTDGQPDVWGKTFTFQIPDHCAYNRSADKVTVYIMAHTEIDAQVHVFAPLDLSKVDEFASLTTSTTYVTINILDTSVKAIGSKYFSDKALRIEADTEVSAVLMMTCDVTSHQSSMATRLLPDDVLSREYFAITMCAQDMCQIQITAVHLDETDVKIRLRLGTGNIAFMFNNTEYKDGEVICVTLLQYQSLQLQAEKRDLTGTHIFASKPISVLSGGRFTPFRNGILEDGLLEQLPPVNTWGDYFLVQQTPRNPSTSTLCGSLQCQDVLKIVAASSDTDIEVDSGTATTNYHLANSGDFVEIALPSDFVKIETGKSVLMMQITEDTNTLEVSAAIVIPVGQQLDSDRILLPLKPGYTRHIMAITERSGNNNLLINGVPKPMTPSQDINGSFFTMPYGTNDFVQISSENYVFPFSGLIYSIIESSMAVFYTMAYEMADSEHTICVLTKVTPGDGIDNDCDGQIDEEPCSGILAEDSDDDAMVNEDCTMQPEPTTVNVMSSSESSSPPMPSSTLLISSTPVPSSSDIMTSSPSVSSSLDVSSSSSPSSSFELSSARSTSSSTTPLSTAIVSGPACGCMCPSHILSTPLEDSEVESLTSSIQKELYVDKNDVSATKRKYISVSDQRPSAQTVGYFGVSLVAVTFIGIFLLDSGTLFKEILNLIKLCKGEAGPE